MAANMRRCLFSGGNCKQQQSKFGAFFLFVFSPFAEGKGVLQVFPCHLHQWDAEKEGWGCVLLQEPTAVPDGFGDVRPAALIACPSHPVAISSPSFQQAASNPSQSQTMLV